jgi:hypothetical protein
VGSEDVAPDAVVGAAGRDFGAFRRRSVAAVCRAPKTAVGQPACHPANAITAATAAITIGIATVGRRNQGLRSGEMAARGADSAPLLTLVAKSGLVSRL